MKRLDQPISAEYLPIRLYRNDLENMERIFGDSSQELEITAEGFQFESIDELATHFTQGRISNLTLEGKASHITIELTAQSSSLYVGSSTNATVGLFYHLDEILKGARRTCWPLYSLRFVWVLNILNLAAILLLYKISNAAANIIFASSLAWVVWAAYINLRRHSTIWLCRRGMVSFWVRKKDDLILAIVSAFFGAILGAVGTILIQLYLK